MGVVDPRAGKIARVAHSSFDAETLVALDALDAGVALSLLIEEFMHGPMPSLVEQHLAKLEQYVDEPEAMREKIPIDLYTDSLSLVDCDVGQDEPKPDKAQEGGCGEYARGARRRAIAVGAARGRHQEPDGCSD